jgi:hypothetical protein
MIRKIRLLTSAAGFLSLFAGPAFPQSTPAPKAAAAKEEALPSADELSEKCAKGSGGKEAWAKLKTMVLTGTIDIASIGMTGTVEIYAKSPNKVLRVISLANGQFEQKQGFDGKAGWKSDPQSGLKPLEGSELEETKVEAVLDSDVRLKELHPDMKVTGRTKVGERDAYTVVTHQPGGKTVTMYMDAQTGLRIAEDSEGPNETGTVEFCNHAARCSMQRSGGRHQICHALRGWARASKKLRISVSFSSIPFPQSAGQYSAGFTYVIRGWSGGNGEIP